MKNSNSQLLQVLVGGTQAGSYATVAAISSVAASAGDVLDSITLNGTVYGGSGGSPVAGLTLAVGEYLNGFQIVSNPGYMGGIVTAIQLTTNLGNTWTVNAGLLPTTNNPPTSAAVTNCYIYAIGLTYGDFINGITIYYISNFTPIG